MSHPKIVFSIGGSVFSKNNYEDALSIVKALKELYPSNIAVVVGGGKVARDFISLGKRFGFEDDQLDYLGIDITRINARIFAYLWGLNNYDVPLSIDQAVDYYKKYDFVVLGGIKPKQSTDAVAAELAVALDAEYVVNVSDVDAVYDADPKRDKNAKPLRKISYDELESLILKEHIAQKPGDYALMDLKAIKILKKTKIKTKFLSPYPLSNLKNIFSEYIGTWVYSNSNDIS